VGNVVVVSDVGPEETVVADLARAGVATVHEAMGRKGLLAAYLRPIYPGAKIGGRAVTVLTQAGDNLMLHVAVEQCRPGDVLVVATMSPGTDGMFGELLATSLRAHGVVGIVIDAGVRDVCELTKMKFPAWSRAVSAQGTVKATPGSVNVPVVIGGVCIAPGDVVVADDDGVVAVPLAAAKEAAVASLLRMEHENEMRLKLLDGVLSLDLMGLRGMLEGLGVEYIDSAK
jgi:4-hydroxy-4-methyl-2-oxoglutarate aldolase